MSTSMSAVVSLDPKAFAAEWVAAWNARDLDRILSHYADDIELVSPRAALVVPSSGGVIRGLAALRAYWTAALARSPDLRFELDDVLSTVSGATLLYRNHRGERVAETFLWNDSGKVTRSVVAYRAS
jgi:ketosteroid isomerase-like protein